LPSAYGIGDLGGGAREFADFLQRAGQTWWQILPLNPTSSFMGGSPYSSYSVFAGNPLFISPEVLVEDGMADESDASELQRPDNGRIDFHELETARSQFLDRLFARFETRLDGLPGFAEFIAEHDENWLDGFALYRALKNRFGGVSWSDWPDEYRDREPGALDDFRGLAARELMRVKFEQYLFFRQWGLLKEYLDECGIKVIADVPVYPTYDSADVWENQKIFKLDDDKAQTVLAGVPPDYFSETGQLWGNPVYDWAALERSGFDWWLRRLELQLKTADAVRLDHFRGFAAAWEVPPDEETAIGGSWAEVPGEAFFQAVRARFPDMPFIAEDLGYITEDVLDLRDRFGLPGMRVLMFSFGDDCPESTNSLHNHTRNSVAYSGTHDNNTARGWFEQEADESQKKRLSLYIGKPAEAAGAPWDLVRLTLSSVARTAIVPLQDVLGLGAEARLNVPATSEGNWTWRLEAGRLDPGKADSLAELTKLFGRA
jgi:4-alpha-glucanotransferase